MLKHLMGRSLQDLSLASGTVGETRIAGIRDAFAAWRAERDIDAILASFARLTDRQLAMLGVRREEIQYVVAELLATAAERWKIGDEVAWMFDDAAEPSAPPGGDRSKDSAEPGVA